MIRTVEPGPRTGEAEIPASKSRAHRLMICAALSGRETRIKCRGISRDIAATAACLRGMGFRILEEGDGITVRPGDVNTEQTEVQTWNRPWDGTAERTGAGNAERPGDAEEDAYAVMPCGESGSTLRFLLPVAGAMGLRGEFRMEGRLPERPLQPLWDVLAGKGMRLRREGNRLFFSGKIRPGEYRIAGNISSQYVSGLLFALPLLEGKSTLEITGPVESADYIAMTEEALGQAGVPILKAGNRYRIPAGGYEHADGIRETEVEADWSSGAFFLCMGALSPGGVAVRGLKEESRQGDRRILEILERFGARVSRDGDRIIVCRGTLRGITVDASGIPDLVPVIAATAAGAEGETVIEHAGRLRLKESDRLKTTTEMLRALGADIRETEDGLRILGKPRLRGGRTDSFRDHRIAMSAAVAAALCTEPVAVENAECTEKSFPGFWEILEGMGK